MKPELLPGVAKDELNLVLGFFSRVDAKASVVLAVDTGMVGYLAGRLPSASVLLSWRILIPLAAFLLIARSMWHLYKGGFPNLTGGNQSLVYFREIAKRTESKFIDEFMAQDETALVKDLLGQAWRNSEILVEKFDHLKLAFVFMALGVFPWVVSLAMFALRSNP